MRTFVRACSVLLAVIMVFTAVAPVQAANLQAKDTVKLQVQNKTGDKVTLVLTGPKTYTVRLTTGKNTQEVIPGKYTFTYQACGKENKGKVNVKANGANLTLPKCSTDKTTSSGGKTIKVTIKNSTGGSLSIYLSGTASYTFRISSGTSKIEVKPGKYNYTVYGCGTSISGSKNFKGGGNNWMFWCY